MTGDYHSPSNGPPPGRSAAGALSADSVHDALSNRRRRYVVYRLQRSEGPMALPDVAAEIAVWETDTESVEAPGSDVERVHVSLHHVHIPKLEDAGIVDYDRDRDVVALSEDAERMESFPEAFTG